MTFEEFLKENGVASVPPRLGGSALLKYNKTVKLLRAVYDEEHAVEEEETPASLKAQRNKYLTRVWEGLPKKWTGGLNFDLNNQMEVQYAGEEYEVTRVSQCGATLKMAGKPHIQISLQSGVKYRRRKAGPRLEE